MLQYGREAGVRGRAATFAGADQVPMVVALTLAETLMEMVMVTVVTVVPAVTMIVVVVVYRGAETLRGG